MIIKQLKNHTNIRSLGVTSYSKWYARCPGEDFSTPAKIADSLNAYFQSVFVKEKTVDEGLSHFTHRCTSCNDDGDAKFSLEALYQEIDKLKDNNPIVMDKASLALSS